MKFAASSDMDPDQYVKDRNELYHVVKEALQHQNPSPETLHLFEDIRKTMADYFAGQDKKLDAIEKQTTMTNGRVTKLEVWQAYVLGFCACLSIILLSVGVPLLFKVLK